LMEDAGRLSGGLEGFRGDNLPAPFQQKLVFDQSHGGYP
jgi:hypothetical protein